MTKDVDYAKANVLREENKARFTEDTSITVNDEAAMQAKGGDFVKIDAKQVNFNLKAAGIQGKGIEVTGGGTEFDLNNPGDVEIDASTGIVTDGQWAEFDLNGDNSNITLHHAKTGILATNKSNIYIKNTLGTTTINNENADDSTFVGVKTQNGGSIIISGRANIDAGAGTALAALGGRIDVNHGATIQTNGSTALVAGNGSRISIASYNFNKPADISIDAGDGLAIDASDGGFTIGSLSSSPRTTNGTVKIKGHIKLGKSGTLNLTKDNSIWTGTAVDGTEDGSGLLHLAMESDAVWNHVDKEGDTGNEVKVELEGTRYKGSSDDQITILQNSKKDIHFEEIDHVDGTLRLVFAHEADSPTSIKGGNVTIDTVSTRYRGYKAKVLAVTDSDGIDMSDDTLVGRVLQSLAQKITYTNPSEAKLVGKVGIADGLTAKSVMLTEGFIRFDPVTGIGSYTPQMVDTFNRSMTGDEAYD